MAAFDHIRSALSLLSGYTQLDLGEGVHLIAVVIPREEGGLLVQLVTDYNSEAAVLHWNIGNSPSATWSDPGTLGIDLPPESTVSDSSAIRTPFHSVAGCLQLSLDFPQLPSPTYLLFALNQGEKWFNNEGKNFSLTLIS